MVATTYIEKNRIMHISINHGFFFFVPKRQKAASIAEAVFLGSLLNMEVTLTSSITTGCISL